MSIGTTHNVQYPYTRFFFRISKTTATVMVHKAKPIATSQNNGISLIWLRVLSTEVLRVSDINFHPSFPTFTAQSPQAHRSFCKDAGTACHLCAILVQNIGRVQDGLQMRCNPMRNLHNLQ